MVVVVCGVAGYCACCCRFVVSCCFAAVFGSVIVCSWLLVCALCWFCWF